MKPPVILVVEDNRIQQRVVEMFIAKCGYSSRTVSCWPELSAVLDAESLHSFALILMDWHLLTGTTGLECTQRLRRMETGTGAHIPIVGMTASAMEGDRDRCIESGMDYVLTKPFYFDDFKATIDSWIRPQSDEGISSSA